MRRKQPTYATILWSALLLILVGTAPAPAQPDESPVRQYAPRRQVDITRVVIDVTPDFDERTIQGVTTIHFTPIDRLLTELKLDAVDLNVASVTSTARIEDFTATDEHITITFRPPLLAGEQYSVTVAYDAEPQRGLYFRTPEMGYPPTDTHLFTQGETHEARHWFPNFDYPNDRFSSEVICRVPPEMTVVSNGRLVSEQLDTQTNLKAVHWIQEKPHVNYLIALVAGYFEKHEDRYRDIPLGFYTPPSQFAQAANSFEGTADMMAFYEEEIGIPYPWVKYDQAVVADFVAGGMENTTLTILTDGTLFTDASENIHSSQGLVAHELVHQWFGDYVTCKDWSHLWLNEGFATYYEDLYDKHKNGLDSFLYGLYRTARQIVSRDAKALPIVTRHYEDADDQFDYRTYGKAGWVLHMLRSQLGEVLYHRTVRTYVERYALGIATTEDFRSVLEEVSGQPFERFFDQWLYHSGFPDLKIAYSWSQEDRLAKVTIEQTQEAGENGTLVFYLPATLRFWLGEEPTDRRITIDSRKHEFYFSLPAEPNIVRFDPDLTLLAKVTFDKPREMLYAQLDNMADVVGRLRAANALEEEKDKKTIGRLKDALNNDPFYGVRIHASAALQSIHTDEAFDALADSLDQDDARVRLRVVEDLGRFYRSEVPELMQNVLADEKNPDIVAAAIEATGRYSSPQTRDVVETYLPSESYRNRLANAAIAALRTLDDAEYIGDLMAVLRDNQAQFRSWDFVRALDTLAYLARHQEDRSDVRRFLADYVNHPKQSIQGGAISALGTLGDPKAIPIVETFRGDEPRDYVERSATRALDDLRKEKPLVPEEIVEMRKQLDELKKETAKLREQLEDLQNKSDARTNKDG